MGPALYRRPSRGGGAAPGHGESPAAYALRAATAKARAVAASADAGLTA